MAEDDKLSTGAKVGIALGVLGALGGLAAALAGGRSERQAPLRGGTPARRRSAAKAPVKPKGLSNCGCGR